MKIQPKKVLTTAKFGVTLYPTKSYNAEIDMEYPNRIKVKFNNVISFIVNIEDVTILNK